MTFYRWLAQQTARRDAVGLLARAAVKDPIYPRYADTLGIILRRYDHDRLLREAAKIAHREWRRLRMRRKPTTQASTEAVA